VIGWIHRLSLVLFLFFSLCALPAWSDDSQTNIVRGEKIYKKSCISCHGNPKSGAPQLNDKKAWEVRIRQPRKRLMQHSLKGFKKMPARGGDSSLNVRNIGDALDYMLFTILGLEDVIVEPSGSSASASSNPSNKDKLSADKLAAGETTKTTAPTSALQTKPEVSGQALNTTTIMPASPDTALQPSQQNENIQFAIDSKQLAHFQERLAPRSEAELNAPRDKYGDDVLLGYRIFTQTAKFAGRYSGNDLSCSNCHLQAGFRKHAAPMWAAIGMYPAYKQANDRNITLEDRILQCFEFNLNGFAPTTDSPEVRALSSYMHFISRGAPVGVNLPGRGFAAIEHTGFDPNPTRGLHEYEKFCSSCHQADGSGKHKAKGNAYEVPPLWGRHAYNKGSSFMKIRKLAGFIKANMPPSNEKLSTQQALDIAAYINQQIRPGDPRKGLFDAWFGK